MSRISFRVKQLNRKSDFQITSVTNWRQAPNMKYREEMKLYEISSDNR